MKSCEQCGAAFAPKRNEQRFCCRTCSNRWVTAHRRSMAGKNNPLYGRGHSEETKRKLSELAQGRNVSEETRAKLSAQRKGKPKPPEWRANIAASLRGNPRVNNAGGSNPNYRHGRYVDERSYRDLVDLSACSNCGRSDAVIDVHHVDDDHSNNDPANLEVLCHQCHGKRHGRPVGVVETRPRRRGGQKA